MKFDKKLNRKSIIKIEQIVDLVKKMKMAIIQQSNQNNRTDQILPLSQLREKVIKEIKSLLKKYPQIKGKRLLKGKNWEEKLSHLDNPQRILALARQLREEIIFSQNNSRGNSPTHSSPASFPVFVIPIGLGVVGIAVLLLIIRRYKKLKSKKDKKLNKLFMIGISN